MIWYWLIVLAPHFHAVFIFRGRRDADMTPQRHLSSDSVIGIVGSLMTWTLAATGWTLTNINSVVNIGAGLGAIAASMVTIVISIKSYRRKARQQAERQSP